MHHDQAQIGWPQFFLTLSAADMSWPKLFQIIVTYFDAKLPAESDNLHAIVSRVQCHSHSVACKKKKQQSCKFHIPRPPSDATLLEEPPSADDNIRSVQNWQSDFLQCVQDALDQVDIESDISLQDVLNSVSVTSEDSQHATLSFLC